MRAVVPPFTETASALKGALPRRLRPLRAPDSVGVRFIMNGADHRMGGPSAFPFPTMGGSWAEHFDLLLEAAAPKAPHT